MAGKKLNVTELDFDTIKVNIKNYFKREGGAYRDWDFEGSGLNHLLDILAYNTHYNAILAHLAVNEGFLSSAQLRKNVVGRAKTLGYLPHSFSASTSTLTLSGSDISSLSTVPKNTIFTSSVGGNSYSFITTESFTGSFAPGAVPSRKEILVKEGSLKTVKYTYDASDTNRRYEIPDSNVDINAIKVTTFPNDNTSDATLYTRFTELSTATSTTDIYFIFENPNGFYEVEFGDGVVGKKPQAGAVIAIEYLSTSGADANGATTFNISSTLTNSVGVALADIVVDTATISSGGGDRETIEEIRFNAPLSFTSQDRAVTVDDYKTEILNASDATAVSVWGGEDNDPVDLGAVYISGKKSDDSLLSLNEKASLRNLLRDKGVLTLRHVFLDPNFIYLYFDVFTRFNPNLTTLNSDSMASAILSTITNFDNANLQEYNSIFRFSKFLARIDATSPAILSTAARVYAYRNLVFNQKLLESDIETTDIIDLSGRASATQFLGAANYTVGNTFYFKDNVYRVKSLNNPSAEFGTAGVEPPRDIELDTDYTMGAAASGFTYQYIGKFSDVALSDAQKKLLKLEFTFKLDSDEADIVYSKEGESFSVMGGINEYRFGTHRPEGIRSGFALLTIYRKDDTSGERLYYDGSPASDSSTTPKYFGIVHINKGIIFLGASAVTESAIGTGAYTILKLTGIKSSGLTVKIFTRPASNDIASKRNFIIDIDETSTNVTAEIDTAALNVTSRISDDYITYNRDTPD